MNTFPVVAVWVDNNLTFCVSLDDSLFEDKLKEALMSHFNHPDEFHLDKFDGYYLARFSDQEHTIETDVLDVY